MTRDEFARRQAAALGPARWQAQAPLAPLTTFNVGGKADWLAEIRSVSELQALLADAAAAGVPVTILGGGSNVLVADEGVRDVVLSLRRACGATSFNGTEVRAGGAVMLPALARAAAERDLGGLEFAIGIPGSVGGALQTNAGISDGRAIGDLARSVEVLRMHGHEAGRIVTLARDEIEFAYRTTSLRGSDNLILGARLGLTARPRAEVDAEMRRLLEARQRSQPTAEPNAGSIFRNPEGDHAGRLRFFPFRR